MLSSIKNFFIYLPLKSLIFIGRLQGLIVFTYEIKSEISYNISPLLCVYSSVYTVLIVISLKILVINILWGLSNYFAYTKVVLIFVYITENVITAYRVMLTYIVQFYYREKFRNILADAIHIHQSIRELMKDAPIFDRTFYRCYFSKVVGVFLQFAGVTYIISLYKRITSTIFQSDIVTFTLISYMHLTAITISGIFYAGMLLILMFYRNLNRKAVHITRKLAVIREKHFNCKIENRLYCRLCDEIDHISYIYDKASAFMKKYNELFSVQLLFAILNTFFVVLTEVRISFCKSTEFIVLLSRCAISYLIKSVLKKLELLLVFVQGV